MLKTINRYLFSNLYKRIIRDREKVRSYIANLQAYETQLNDECRMFINSIKGFVNAEKYINKSGKVNIQGFMNSIKQKYPKVYSSNHFRQYNKRIIYLQSKISHEKKIINRYTRYYNEKIENSPFLCKKWDFEKIEYYESNKGRDIDDVSDEYNKLNNVKF